MEQIISLEVTTKCNLRCMNCFAHEDSSNLGDMDFTTAKQVLKEGSELGFTKMTITGGEPFLWPELIELLKYARLLEYGFILINTNAHLLNEKLCKKLSGFNGILQFSCSLNGSESDHDKVRGPGSYIKAIKGIESCLKYNLNISIFTVVNKENLDSIPDIFHSLYIKYPKIQSFFLIQLRGIENDYFKVKDLKLEPEDFIKMVKLAGYLSLASIPVHILENPLSSVVADKLGLSWLSQSLKITRQGKIVVLQNGAITVNHSSHTILGSYSPGKLEKVILSSAYNDKCKENTTICTDCEFIEQCRKSDNSQPSSQDHNTGDRTVPFCKKVLGLLN